MKFIKPKKIEPETVDVYHKFFGLVGTLNEYEFNDFRIQIKRENGHKDHIALTDYFVKTDSGNHCINTLGQVKDQDFFNLIPDQLDELTQW